MRKAIEDITVACLRENYLGCGVEYLSTANPLLFGELAADSKGLYATKAGVVRFRLNVGNIVRLHTLSANNGDTRYFRIVE